ncbi:hypothetical protein ACVPOS_11725 [Staphylococcus aureus]
MQAVTQANTALNGIQNLERAKQAANTAITNASDLNTKQKRSIESTSNKCRTRICSKWC